MKEKVRSTIRDAGGEALWGSSNHLVVLENPVLKVLVAIADAVTPAEVHTALVDRIGDAVGASSVGLWLVDAPGGTATLVRSRGYSDAAERAMRRLDVGTAPGLPILDSIRSGEPIWIASQAALYDGYPHLRGLATADRSYRVSCLPLVASGRVLGALGVTIEAAGQASAEEREFLLLVARYATHAIERLRLYEAERESRARVEDAAERLRILNHASRAFSAADLDVPARLNAAAAELSRTFESVINLGLLQEDGLLHLVAAHHPEPEAQLELGRLALGHPLRLGEGFTGTIAATGESKILPAVDPEAAAQAAPPPYRELLRRFPVYAVAGAALRVRGRIIGTVTAARIRQGQTYATEDLSLLEELAERIALAVENARLYQDALEARTRAEQLYRFAQAVAAGDRVEVVYEAALDSIAAALNVARAAVLTFDEQNVMRFRAWRGLSDRYRAAVDGHSPWSADARSPQPVIVDDALADPAWATYAEEFRREGIGSLAFIPLATRERLVGKLMLYSERPHAFTAKWLDTARAIANHLASVIARFAALAKLEETIRYNDLLAGMLAHDLRNPLGAITGGTALLLTSAGRDPARITDTAGRIRSSADLMARMIDELLDFTRVRAGGGITIERQVADVERICAAVASEFELSQPSLAISVEARGDLSGAFDRDRLQQVISNLIANAGQHGRAGAPVRVTLDGERPDAVVLGVHNQGAMPPALLPHVFDPFRTTERRQGRSSGLGLGLFIVREIVRAHGGTVEVSSSEEAGTTVSVRLPR